MAERVKFQWWQRMKESSEGALVKCNHKNNKNHKESKQDKTKSRQQSTGSKSDSSSANNNIIYK